MEVLLQVQMILITDYGEFVGRKVTISVEQYHNFVKMSKNYYNSGFELTCEDGSYMVFSPEVVAKSILKIKKKLVSNNEELNENNDTTDTIEPSKGDENVENKI